MKYHLILNGCLEDIKRQAEELNYFTDKFCTNMEMGSSLIFIEKGMDAKTFEVYAPTMEIICLEVPYYQPEMALEQLTPQMNSQDIYLFGNSYSLTELAVRASERMGGTSVLSAQEISVQNRGIYVKKMVYSSYMEAEFLLKRAPFCISLSKGLGEKAMINQAHQVSLVRCSEGMKVNHVLSRTIEKEVKEETLENAKVLVIAGRGIKQKEQIEDLERLSASLNGELGVSRPVAMNAWAPMNRLIGVSGTMAKPELCITFGVSGAPAFYAGIEKSKLIVAINSDVQAPIMKNADVSVIDDSQAMRKAIESYIESYRRG